MTILQLLTYKAFAWTHVNLNLENYQIVGFGNIAIDQRYIDDIIEGMKADGLTPLTDFQTI